MFVLVGYWQFGVPPEEYVRPRTEFVVKAGAVMSVLFFGWIGINTALEAIIPSRLILSSSGIRIEGVSHRSVVNWGDVENFFLLELHLQKLIYYRLRQETPDVSGRRRHLVGLYEADPDTIVAALNSRLKRYRLQQS